MTFISLAFLALVVLASCSHTKVTASIDGKSVYAKSGNYSITNKELWDELKWNSYDIINEKTEEAILKKEFEDDLDYNEIARRHSRTQGAIIARLIKMGLVEESVKVFL